MLPDRRDTATFVRATGNAIGTFGWLAMVPVAFWFGWLESVVFVSACSIYANAASHLAAWLTDLNPQLDRIERMLEKLLDEPDRTR